MRNSQILHIEAAKIFCSGHHFYWNLIILCDGSPLPGKRKALEVVPSFWITTNPKAAPNWQQNIIKHLETSQNSDGLGNFNDTQENVPGCVCRGLAPRALRWWKIGGLLLPGDLGGFKSAFCSGTKGCGHPHASKVMVELTSLAVLISLKPTSDMAPDGTRHVFWILPCLLNSATHLNNLIPEAVLICISHGDKAGMVHAVEMFPC